MRAPSFGLCLALTLATSCEASGASEENPPNDTKEVDEPTAPLSRVPETQDGRDAMTKTGRPPEDIERDAARKPQQVMDFFGIEEGMRVVELMSGRGYYAELLLERVGAGGEVWAHNSAFVLDRFARKPLAERLERIGAPNLHGHEAELDDPKLPSELDAVLMILFYHDTYWQKVDRKAMNAAVFASLKPGGVYGIVDHHAEVGSGERDVESIHRVDMELVQREILEAGFVLDSSSDLLSRPDDARTRNVFEMRGETDRFVLRFVKPR